MSIPFIEVPEGQQSPFCSTVPHLYKAWDNTLISNYKDCGYKHFLSALIGLNNPKPKPAMDFGILYHKVHEYFEKKKAEGDSQRQAIEYAIHRILHDIKAEGYDNAGDNRYKTENIIRAFVWHTMKYGEKDPAETVILANGKAAVELSFTVELPIISPDGDHYLYCGHIDRLVRFGKDLLVLDHKTTTSQLNKQYFEQYNPNSQLSGYIYGCRVNFTEDCIGAYIDACHVAVTLNRYARHMEQRSTESLEEWLHNTCHWIKRAEAAALASDWEMNEQSCHHYGRGCDYRDLCRKDPRTRNIYMKSNYDVRLWNPLEAR